VTAGIAAAHPLAAATSGNVAAVTAADHRDASPPFAQRTRERLHHGGFAAPSRSQVANDDHRNRKAPPVALRPGAVRKKPKAIARRKR